MFKRLFVDHPKSVDESYVQHFGVAGQLWRDHDLGRAVRIGARSRPWLVRHHRAAARSKRLNAIMVIQRRAKGQEVTQMLTVDWVI